MIETVEFEGIEYPKFQTVGFAAEHCFSIAKKILSGQGLDIGCNRMEWCFPGAIPIDTSFTEFEAMRLPEGEFDYIFSSHCLEHLPDWVGALDYWTSKLKVGGVLFLYLPDFSQEYWRPYHNRKHYHSFEPKNIRDYLVSSKQYKKIFVSGVDAYNSFTAFAEKI